MSYHIGELTGSKKVSNEYIDSNGELRKHFSNTRRVEFILFNVPTKTGVVANRPYISLLENIVIGHCETYYKGQYKISKFREDYILIPDEGYRTKVFVKTVFVTTKTKTPDEKKYFNSLDY